MLKGSKANEVLDYFRESFCEMINKPNDYYRNFDIHEDTFEIHLRIDMEKLFIKIC